MLMTGIQKKSIVEFVAGIESSQLMIDILVTVIVDIGKRDAVPLLQMTKPSRVRYVLKSLTSIIPEHDIGYQRRKIWFSGRQIDVKKTIIVEISKIGAHGIHDAIKLSTHSDIAKRTIALVFVEPWIF